MLFRSRKPLALHVFATFAVGGPQVRFAALAAHLGDSWRHMIVAMDGKDPFVDHPYSGNLPIARPGTPLGTIPLIKPPYAQLSAIDWATPAWTFTSACWKSTGVQHLQWN